MFVERYKELFTLYNVMSVGLCRTLKKIALASFLQLFVPGRLVPPQYNQHCVMLTLQSVGKYRNKPREKASPPAFFPRRSIFGAAEDGNERRGLKQSRLPFAGPDAARMRLSAALFPARGWMPGAAGGCPGPFRRCVPYNIGAAPAVGRALLRGADLQKMPDKV